jgi:hypothetical protein
MRNRQRKKTTAQVSRMFDACRRALEEFTERIIGRLKGENLLAAPEKYKLVRHLIRIADLMDDELRPCPTAESMEDAQSSDRTQRVLAISRREIEHALGCLGVKTMETPERIDYAVHAVAYTVACTCNPECDGRICDILRQGYRDENEEIVRRPLVAVLKYEKNTQQ